MRREVKTGLITRNGVGFCGIVFPLLFLGIDWKEGRQLSGLHGLGMQQKVTHRRPLSAQRTGKRCLCKKKSVAESFFFFFLNLFSLYVLESFPPGPRWVGFPAPRGLCGPQFPLGGGGAPATGLSVRRAAAPPEGEGHAAPGLGKRHGRPLSPAPARSTELGESRLDPRDCCSPSGRLPSPHLEEEFTRLSVTNARVLKRLCSLTAVVAFCLWPHGL